MAKTCSVDLCNNPVFSKGYCLYHYPKKSIKKVSDKQKVLNISKNEKLIEDWKFYEKVLENREHICEECGVGISEPNSANCHHILPKRSYGELRHVEDNIAVLCLSCHSKVETSIDFTPKMKELTRLKLLEYAKSKGFL